MHRAPLGLLLVAFTAACHGVLFGDRTSKADQDLNNFAEARERAAFYYDGGDYIRAALQFQRALQYKKDHVPTRLGLAYSLTYINKPTSLLEGRRVFEALGKLDDDRQEVKRVYGMALNARSLAVHYERRSRIHEKAGRLDLKDKDEATARKYATESLRHFESVIRMDDEAATRQKLAPLRASASLKPDAYVGMAHCEIILADYDPERPENLKTHLERAEDYIQRFAKITRMAREFWEKKREAVMVAEPLTHDGSEEPATLDAQFKERYQARINATLVQEAEIREALMHTQLYLNRFQDAIDQAGMILQLDPRRSEIYLWRGHAFAFLQPPNYRAAVRDLKRYRASRDPTRLTEELVQINRRILDYEKRADEQDHKVEASGS